MLHAQLYFVFDFVFFENGSTKLGVIFKFLSGGGRVVIVLALSKNT